jgi:hypothetical protein
LVGLGRAGLRLLSGWRSRGLLTATYGGERQGSQEKKQERPRSRRANQQMKARFHYGLSPLVPGDKPKTRAH